MSRIIKCIYTFITVLDNLKTVDAVDVGVTRSLKLPPLMSASKVASIEPVRIVPNSLKKAFVPS